MPHLIPSRLGGTIVALLTLAGVGSAAELDVFQGQWLTRKTNEEGRVYSQKLTFSKNKLEIRIVDAAGDPILVAKATVGLERQGPLGVMTFREITAGRSEAELESVDETGAAPYRMVGSTLYLAANFDREREDRLPHLDIYRRPDAWPAAATATPDLSGNWKLVVTLEGQDLEYDLKLRSEGGKWMGTLISPRSGPHELDSVQFSDGTLRMKVDRKLDDANATFNYEGKLEGPNKISGPFRIESGGNEIKGTWKAEK